MVSIAASQLQGYGFNSGLGSLSVWSLHVLPMSGWVSSGCSGFLPQSKDAQVKWTGHAKIAPQRQGIRWVNTWGCRDRAWVGLWLMQARWAEWPLSAL